MNSVLPITVESILNGWLARAELLAPLVVIGYILGEYIARGPLNALLSIGDRFVHRLGKVDKAKRGIATLVYRGMVAVFLLLIPAMLLAAAASYPHPIGQTVTMFFLVGWFGHCYQTFSSVALWKTAKADGLPLELRGLDYLFVDHHAVMRYLVAERINGFSVGVVGGCFWYLLGNLPLMAVYLVLGAAADVYRSMAFGWAARSLFAVMDVAPRFIARVLLTLAAIFTPHTNPFAGLFATNWRVGIANTLGIALGGPGPNGELPWYGKGTARLTPQHLQRTLYLILVATILLVLMLASPTIVNILTKMH